MVSHDDTGKIPIVKANCKYLSKEFHERLDREYGEALHSNGGHVTITIRMDGKPFPRFWEYLLRHLWPDHDC